MDIEKQINKLIKELKNYRETFFTPGHENSYRRNRYEKWDRTTKKITKLSDAIGEE